MIQPNELQIGNLILDEDGEKVFYSVTLRGLDEFIMLKYVHQLQNAYFLTGEELNIN